jgi:hypothetical protein
MTTRILNFFFLFCKFIYQLSITACVKVHILHLNTELVTKIMNKKIVLATNERGIVLNAKEVYSLLFIKEPDHFILMIKNMFGKENIR